MGITQAPLVFVVTAGGSGLDVSVKVAGAPDCASNGSPERFTPRKTDVPQMVVARLTVLDVHPKVLSPATSSP